ncbi:MAG: glycosyltransferase [Candidatus Bathyarchaeia archaeon]
MKPKIKVTVGLCVKNSEESIEEALRSIFEQDFPKELMEIIVVEGYSRDRTLSIIRRMLPKSNIFYKIFREEKGLGYARQIVVDNSVGDYIIWVDGDMILPKNFIRKQVEFMELNPDVGIAKGKYGPFKQRSLVASLEDLEFVIAFEREREVLFEPLGASGCIYRTKAIKQVGGFDANFEGVGEDMDVEYKIRVAGWRLCISSASFYEKRRATWQTLWKEYLWHGMGGYRFFKKYNKVANSFAIFPPILLLKKFIQIARAYKIVRQKRVILLPIHYIFKRTAWIFGFLREFLNNKRLRSTRIETA